MRYHNLLAMNQVMNNYDLRAYSIGFYEDLFISKKNIASDIHFKIYVAFNCKNTGYTVDCTQLLAAFAFGLHVDSDCNSIRGN